MTPGQVYRITVTAFPTSNLFKRGHRHPARRFVEQFPAFRSQPEHGCGGGEGRRSSGRDESSVRRQGARVARRAARATEGPIAVLTWLGFGMVITFMTLIMTRRLSPLVALIAVPILFALLGGFGAAQLGEMMLAGLRTLAPTGVMLMFAILYFGLMIDAGLFDPLIGAILRAVRGDPTRIVIGTALLAALVSLDGDGSTTYMITVASMLPLYRRLRLDPLNLTCVTILAGGVMNLTPWGGPLARAASALHVDPADVFVPMLPAMAVGLVGVFWLAWFLGRREKLRLGHLSLSAAAAESTATADSALLPPESNADHVRRPKLLVVNALLTLSLLVALVLGVLPLPVLFMIAFAVALVINYPKVADQRERIAAHSEERDCGRLADFCGGHLHRHPRRHRHARCDGEEHARARAVFAGPLSRADHCAGEPAVHVLRLERRVLLRRRADRRRDRSRVRYHACRNRPCVADRPAGALAEPAGALYVPARRPGRRGVRRSPALHVEVGGAGVPADVGCFAIVRCVSAGRRMNP